MKHSRKILIILLLGTFVLFTFTACSSSKKSNNDDSSFDSIATSYTHPNPNYAGGTSNYIITINNDGTFNATESKTVVKGTDHGFLIYCSSGHGKFTMLQGNTDLYTEITIDSLEYDTPTGKTEYENGDEIQYREFVYLYKGKKLIVYKEGSLISDLPDSIRNQINSSNTCLIGTVLYDKENDMSYWSQKSINAY